ncbi:hypothetical protein RB595_002911 [Gaeumannomyces hyphopodioides]
MSSSTRITDSSDGLAIIKCLTDRKGYAKVLLHRESDGEVLLGQTLEGEGQPARIKAIVDSGFGEMLENLLNHENLVSIAGYVSTTDPKAGGEPGKIARYVAWDYCDAGTLEMLFRDPPVLPRSGGFLPASLCWHVVLSLLRGLAWLHDGYREDEAAYMVDRREADARFGDDPRLGVQRHTRPFVADPDWMPVLHRAITPNNVFFQQPRGIETYGLCKLGNYSQVHVSGHVNARSVEGIVVAPEKGDAPVMAMWVELLKGKAGIRSQPKNKRPYTQGSELFAVGALLYRMMTFHELPDPDECPDCGCLHLDPDAPSCLHDCRGAVDVSKGHELFDGLLAEYAGLDEVVGDLLQHHRSTKCPPTWEVYRMAQEAFEQWRLKDADGRMFVTLEDDLHRRWDFEYAAAAQRKREGSPLQISLYD